MNEAGAESPHLDRDQQDQAAEHAPLRGIVIHEIIRAEGEADLKRPAHILLLSGLAAGLSMGFSFAVQALLHAQLSDAPWRHSIASAGYAVGFVIVVLGRQQLFTETTLSATLPALTRRDLPTTASMLRLWGLVLAANLAGTWLFAAAMAFASPFDPATDEGLATLSREALAHPFGVTMVKAVFAGWLIALMAWLLPTVRDTKILIIALLAWVVALGRLSHVIAGSTEAAYQVLTGGAGGSDYLLTFLLPTLIGNTIGGVALVALLNHMPASDEMSSSP
jgi:formate-nitrite transporter family protein